MAMLFLFMLLILSVIFDIGAVLGGFSIYGLKKNLKGRRKKSITILCILGIIAGVILITVFIVLMKDYCVGVSEFMNNPPR